MKGGLFATAQADFFALACTILTDGRPDARCADGTLQIQDDVGRLFTLFDDAGADWEWADVLRRLEEADGGAVRGYAFECRWEDMLAGIGARLQAQIEKPVWVVDGDGVEWPAAAIDVERIVL